MQFLNDIEDDPKTLGNRNTRVYKRVLKSIIPDLKNLSPQERDKIYKERRKAFNNFTNIVFGNRQQLRDSTIKDQVDIIVGAFNNLKDILPVIAKA